MTNIFFKQCRLLAKCFGGSLIVFSPRSIWYPCILFALVICKYCPFPLPLTGIAWTIIFIIYSTPKSPSLQGPSNGHCPALYNDKFLGGVYVHKSKSPTLPEQLHFRLNRMKNISEIYPLVWCPVKEKHKLINVYKIIYLKHLTVCLSVFDWN